MNSYFVLLIVGFAGFISAADNWVASLLLPGISNSFGVTVSTASIVLTAYLIPYGVMQPVYGFFSDRQGKTKVLKYLMICLAVATFFCAKAPDIKWLTAFRFITGFFAAGIIAVSLGILGEYFEKSQLTKVVGLFLGIVFLGQGISAGLGGWLIEHIGWRDIFVIFSVLAVISFGLVFLISPVPVNDSQGKFWHSIGGLIRDRQLRAMYLLACCNGFAVLGGYSFIGSYLYHDVNVSYSYVGIGLMLFGFVSFISGFVNKFLLAKLSPASVLNLGFSSSFLALAIFSQNKSSLFISYIAILMLGMGYVWVQSILASKALDLAPSNRGLSSGIIGVGIFCGGGIGTYVGSLILKSFSYAVLFSSFAVIIVVTLGLYNIAGKSQERKASLEEEV